MLAIRTIACRHNNLDTPICQYTRANNNSVLHDIIVHYTIYKFLNLLIGTRSCTSAGQGSLNTDHRSPSWLNRSLAHLKKWLDMCILEHLAKMDLKFLNNNNIIII